MSVLATLLFSLSLLAGIIFLILCVATKMQKKIVKPQYSKGLLISVITLFFSFMLVLIFTPTQTETKKESKPKKKVETVTSTPESTDTTTTTDDNSPTEEERINKFVEEAKTVTQDSIGENEQITNIEYNNRDLRVYVDLSQATPDPLTYEDLAISRTSSITDQAMKSDAQKTYERNSQPVIEEKNRAIGKTYMSNFLLRKALSMANTAVSSDEVASNE